MKYLILRTCDAKLRGHGGFQWPSSGHVKAPDWNPEPKCGGGLHGFLWGQGDGSLANFAGDSRWLVVGVDEYVDLDGKVKFPRGEVFYVGTQYDATQFLLAHPLGAGKCVGVIGATVSSGDRGTSTSDDGGTSTSDDGGTSTSDDGGTSTSGSYGTLVFKWYDGSRYRRVVAYVGEDGILPNVAYHCIDGKVVPK